MFTSIPSLDSVLQFLLPVFTQPSFQTHIEVLLGWVMCLSKRTEYGVFQTIQADTPVSRKERHPFDRFYNFFSRSAWVVRDLAHQVAVTVVVQLNPRGLLYLVVDDTLLHKRGKNVYGLGWFRDAVASTAKRVATASGNHWVVAITMVALLAGYQTMEFLMCQVELQSSFFPYLAFVIISFLPPLNLTLTLGLTPTLTLKIVVLIFIPAIFFSIYYTFIIPEFAVTSCTVLYATYHYPLGDLFGFFYYLPILISIILLALFIKKKMTKRKK